MEVSINYGKIEAHICICFVALKVYKELDRILKLNGIKLSIDKVLRMAKTVTTIQVQDNGHETPPEIPPPTI